MNIRDAESSFLVAAAQSQEWQQEFERQWYRPVGKMMLRLMVANMSPQQAMQVAQKEPAALERVKQLLGGK